MKKTDLFVGLYILAAIVFLIISVPSGLLDVLLAFNMAVALVILFMALFSKEPLDMQAVPYNPAFTTIFVFRLMFRPLSLFLEQAIRVML